MKTNLKRLKMSLLVLKCFVRPQVWTLVLKFQILLIIFNFHPLKKFPSFISSEINARHYLSSRKSFFHPSLHFPLNHLIIIKNNVEEFFTQTIYYTISFSLTRRREVRRQEVVGSCVRMRNHKSVILIFTHN